MSVGVPQVRLVERVDRVCNVRVADARDPDVVVRDVSRLNARHPLHLVATKPIHRSLDGPKLVEHRLEVVRRLRRASCAGDQHHCLSGERRLVRHDGRHGDPDARVSLEDVLVDVRVQRARGVLESPTGIG